MSLRLTVVYDLKDVDVWEVWLEKSYENIQPPAYLKEKDVIELSFGDCCHSFQVGSFSWYMPENEISIILNPFIRPDNWEKLLEMTKIYLSDDWTIVDGNTTYNFLDILKKEGHSNKIS